MLIQLIIIQIVTFGLLIFLLRFLFVRNLNTASTRLNTLLEENMVKETQLTEELKLAKEERDAEIKRGKLEAAAIIEESKNDGIKLRLKMEEETKQHAEKIISEAKEEANKLKEKIIKETHEKSLYFAVEMIEKTLTEENKEDLQVKFINDTIKEISKLPQERFSVSSNNVKIVSSFPLNENQRENLKLVLFDKLRITPVLEETVNKELISGLLLDMDGLVIDGTLKNRLRMIIPHLKKI